MPDWSRLPPHLKEAVEKKNLVEKTLERARSGRDWLDQNAPSDWRLQMISITKGKVESRVRLAYGEQTPLALAFRRVSEFWADGKFSWILVHKKFFPCNSWGAKKHGLQEMSYALSGGIFIPAYLDGELLDEAWKTILYEFRWFPHIPPYEKTA